MYCERVNDVIIHDATVSHALFFYVLNQVIGHDTATTLTVAAAYALKSTEWT